MSKNSFYEEIMQNNYYEEKVASSEEVKETMADSFSTDQLEILAAELNLAISEKQGTKTSEEKVAEETRQAEREEEKEEQAKETANESAGEPKEDEREATQSEAQEQAKAEKTQERIVNPEAEELAEESKEASGEAMSNIIKLAYNLAEGTLAESGFGTADYVYGRVGDEKIALSIAEKAEKLAYVSDLSPLQVADDILFNIASKINGEQ